MTQSHSSIKRRSPRTGRKLATSGSISDPGMDLISALASFRNPEKRYEKTYYDEVVLAVTNLTKMPLEDVISVITASFDSQAEVAHFETFARGTEFGLDSAGRIVAIRVDAERLREGQRLWSIVGMVKGDAPDVAERHDDYLAEIYMSELHGP
jgi:hypothetical protein